MEKNVEDRTVGNRDLYKRYSPKKDKRIAVNGKFADANVKFLYVLDYLGQGITSLSGYPRGTRVRIRRGSLAEREAYISGFYLAKIRQTYHKNKVAYSLITMCSLCPINEGESNQVVPEFSDGKNGKIFLFEKDDYDVVDDSMRRLMRFHTQSSSETTVLVIDHKGNRGVKPSTHVIGREGDSHEVDIDKAIAFLQEMKEEIQKAG